MRREARYRLRRYRFRETGTYVTGTALLLLAGGAAVEGADIFLEKPRKAWEEKGLSFEAVYTGDMVSNLEGGRHHKTTYLGNLALAGTWDLGRTGWIPGGRAYLSANNAHGGENPTAETIKDLQTVDNIEARDAMHFHEWWYEQTFLKEKLSVLVGAQGLDSEFAVTEYGCPFIHSSFGTPPEMTVNVPTAPVFPLPGLGARVKIVPHEQFELRAAVYDGDPTDGGKNHHGVRYRLSSRQGLMAIFEATFHPKLRSDLVDVYRRCFHPISRRVREGPHAKGPLPGSIKFGSWLHTRDADDVLATNEEGDPIRHRNNYGLYGLIDQMIFQEKPGTDEGLGAFVQFGGAPDDRNTVDYYFGVGLNYRGLIPGRDRDIFGVGLANAFLSERLKKARNRNIDAFDPAEREAQKPGELQSNESALEFTYRMQVNDRVAVQPDYQIVFNPGGEENANTAHVFLLRFEVVF